MPTLPATGYLENSARTVAEMKTALEAVRDKVSVGLGGAARVELTVSTGTVTPATRDHGGVFTLDTEGDAAADDLDTITYTNLPDGTVIVVMAENASRVVTLKDANGGAGEMLLSDSADYALNTLDRWVMFQRRGTAWVELTRSRDNFVGDSGSGGRAGLVPAPGSGDSEKFLQASGGWVAGAQIATGTYTGDGTTSQAITGLGFAPKFVMIAPNAPSEDAYIIFWTFADLVDDMAGGAAAFLLPAQTNSVFDNRIKSLDSDGFTVSDDGLDAAPNKNAAVYNYICIG